MATASVTGAQIDIGLSWSPATDNVGVSTYLLYHGTSPDALSLIAQSPTTSYVIPNAPPQTTYYFAVSAADAVWNQSERSAPVPVTTPVIPDTRAPIVTVGYPTEGSTVSRVTYLYAAAYDLRAGSFDVPSGPAAVQFQIDGENVGPEQTVPYQMADPAFIHRVQFDTRIVPDGLHIITATARDHAGNVATSAGVTVRVNN